MSNSSQSPGHSSKPGLGPEVGPEVSPEVSPEGSPERSPEGSLERSPEGSPDPSRVSGSVPMLTVDQVLNCPEAVVVDLRSPQEYSQDHLRGAVNVPLFGDLQRSMVGFLFNQISPDAALEKGQQYALARVRSLAQEVGNLSDWQPPAEDFEARVLDLCAAGVERMETRLAPEPWPSPGERPVVLHCWRGGLRSRSVVAFLSSLGLDRAVGLTGGYKAYRQYVLTSLERLHLPKPYVLHGLTGVGKTLVLREIERLRPGWTVDLEALAGHRSSLLGMVGMEPCSQKTFDSRLFEALARGFEGPLVVEGESRKVGDVVLPEKLWQSMGDGHALWLEASMEVRERVLIEDYLGGQGQREPLRRQLESLARFLPKEVPWLELFDQHREGELVRGLLERHYDPLYRHGFGEGNCEASFDTEDVGSAAQKIIAWIEAQEPR